MVYEVGVGSGVLWWEMRLFTTCIRGQIEDAWIAYAGIGNFV